MTIKEIREQTVTVRIYGAIVGYWLQNRKTGETVRLEGRNLWKNHEFRNKYSYFEWIPMQEEVEYTEYRLNGEIKQTGSVDMIPRNRPTKRYWLNTWDGSARWQNGFRSFTNWGLIETDKTTKKADLVRVLRATDRRCKDAAEIRLD